MLLHARTARLDIRRNRLPLDSNIHADVALAATTVPAKLASMGALYVPRENTWNRGTIQTGAINALQVTLHLAWAPLDQMRLHVRFVQVGLKVAL